MKIVYRSKKTISFFLLILMTAQVFLPGVTFALTSGPSQPEVQSFQPSGTTEMVDLFSGDFSYNIPLFELPGPNGGYPFNLSYQSGIGMDQESSWCGLGWNLQPGAITRQMRGLPDEFKGDSVYTKMSINPNVTIGLGAGIGAKFFGGNLKVSIGMGILRNNYRGNSYSIDGSVGYSKTNSSNMSAGVGLSFSLDSKEGVNVNPSLSLGSKVGEVGVGAGYNSKQGLTNISGSFSYANKKAVTDEKGNAVKDEKGNDKFKSFGLSGSATLSLVHPGYTPQISMPMKSLNLAATFRIGAAWWGLHPNVYVNGFYNEQTLQNDKKRVASNAYGYLHYQDASSGGAMLDVNREKDGMVIKESSNLAIPCLSYDIYSVSGQGISAMYRPFRNDYGIVNDPETVSKSTGFSAGVDIAPAASHIGVNLGVNHSRSTSGLWTKNNDMKGSRTFQDKKIDDLYEPWYFKVHGEASLESIKDLDTIGGEDPVRVQLGGDDINPVARGTLETNKGRWQRAAPSNAGINRSRKPRHQVIQNYTNEQLMGSNGEVISYLKIKYIDSAGAEQIFNRKALRRPHHIAAFTALTAEGLRYNYGLPAYNLKQEEVTFSVTKKAGQIDRVDVGNSDTTSADYKRDGDPKYDAAGTEKFLKRVEMPPFAHSHLLTSILGPDYVDVTGDGVTEDDLGYWVKFTYKKTTTDAHPFLWRDPYSKAHFQEGWKTDPRDDKGSFLYGEKEMWYLARAETKSHIATFHMAAREDGRGVNRKLQDTNDTGKPVYALKEIRLFARYAGPASPIKVVKLEQDYSLCKGIDNSRTGRGKLTLKKLWFEYGSSQRGKLNPYIFDYNEGLASSNPGYDNHAYDRWGNYKPYPTTPQKDFLYNHDFPYCDQDPAHKDIIDATAAVWSLKAVQLPSGGKILIDYESDDYGYVQHLPAMQMVDIVDPNFQSVINLKDNNLRVYFKLEAPISDSLQSQQQQAEVLKYLDTRRKQLYFKLKISLRKPEEAFYEYVSGYADINMTPTSMGLKRDASNKFTYGYFEVKGEQGHHPFSMRAWQHVRTNQPELANSAKRQDQAQTVDQTEDTGKRIEQIKSLGSVGAQIKQMFQGFYKFCAGENWGRHMIAGKSWVRLNSPDKIKYGGGLRVMQITMMDQWDQDREGVYGQVYEYDIEENKKKISSGVATYEPFIGGDENALRYAKKYVQSIPLRSDNNMFFEYPINETYYPGAQVGYRKVTVRSLASASLEGIKVKIPGGRPLFPKGAGVSYGTTGKTEHEFYTAKDFPVIADETDKVNKQKKLAIPIPLIGSITLSKLSTSQGYSIITNDMHGKPMKVSNYRQDKSGKIEPTPISWVKYNYFSKPIVYQQQNVFGLTNIFKDNGDGSLSMATAEELKKSSVKKFTLGQENEFFTDMRDFEDITWAGGVNINTEILYILWFVVPAYVPWPNLNRTTIQLRTAVANKVIFKSGVLKSVEAFDGGSIVKTENLKWNKLTAEPVLTSVNNNFDAPVYNYTVPAFTQYQGMGAAYQNIGLNFTIKNVQQNGYNQKLYQFTTVISKEVLFPGDEIIIYDVSSKTDTPVGLAVYMGEEGGAMQLYSDVPLTLASYKGLIVRSGYRNQLSVSAGNITALADPSAKGSVTTFKKNISIPK